MKDFDIENLERKIPYHLPANFFEQMQENVLRETIYIKRVKIFSFNWLYAAAASLALIFGANYFLKTQENTSASKVERKVAVSPNSREVILQAADEVPNIEPPRSQKVLTENLTLPKVSNQNHSYASTAQLSVLPRLSPESSSAVQVEDILAEFSDEDLNMVTTNSEQDIYLDLYN